MMDKYTVDLDKVLNDFEYSELTEQTEHHRPSIEARASTAATKHSINNVFNSLNEYLNTEIADHSKPIEAGNRDGKVQYYVAVGSQPTELPNNPMGFEMKKSEDDPNHVRVDFEKYSSDVPIQSSIVTATGCNKLHEVEKQLEGENKIVETQTEISLKVDDGDNYVHTEDNLLDLNQVGVEKTENYAKKDGELIEFSPDQETNKLEEIGDKNNCENFVKKKLSSKKTKVKNNSEQNNTLQDQVGSQKVQNAVEILAECQDTGKESSNKRRSFSDQDREHLADLVVHHLKLAGKKFDLQKLTCLEDNCQKLTDLLDYLKITDVDSRKITDIIDSLNPDLVDGLNLRDLVDTEKIDRNIQESNNQVTNCQTDNEKISGEDTKSSLVKEEITETKLSGGKMMTLEIQEIADKVVVNNSVLQMSNELPENFWETKEAAEEKTKFSNMSSQNEITDLVEEYKNVKSTHQLAKSELDQVAGCQTDKQTATENSQVEETTKTEHQNIQQITEEVTNCQKRQVVDCQNVTQLTPDCQDLQKITDLDTDCQNLKKITDLDTDCQNVKQIMDIADETIEPRLRSHPDEQSTLDEQQTSLAAVIADLEATEDVVGFSSDLNMDESEFRSYLENLDAELEESDAIVKSEEGAVSVETSDRPKSLDFSGTSEGGKREINLIGNPGSTPYNNLYVSKEIPAAKPTNYESESSASVSPTFSEASTGSVRSSDSTDSENEGAKIDKVKSTAGSSSDIANANEPQTTVPESEDSEDIYVDIDALAASGDSIAAQQNPSEEEEAQNLWLGKRAPLWIPDADAINCLHCDMKFTVIKRRHHCRACGLVLCSKCCNSKHRLEYLEQEARVCTKCHDMLSKDTLSSSGSEISSVAGSSPRRPPPPGQPNPNNPMEYCSVVPPMQQVSSSGDVPPTVMVPVGVLKRTGSNKTKHNKSVMFCDGIRPGSDLTNLDNDFNYNDTRTPAAVKQRPPAPLPPAKINRNNPVTDPNTKSFIPENENCLPPTVTTFKSDTTYTDCANNANVVEMLKNETLTFALQRNLHIHVRLISMECCINKQAWCFSTEGLIAVGQDEIVILLEYIDNERMVPKDVFYHLNNVYNDAIKGSTVAELGISMHPTTNFLDSKNHAGFIYVRPTYQCLQNVIVPKESYLVGILVHRWETPWAKLFPLRLVLRLGAEYRYYPTPLISSRHRDSVFVEIGHTIINLLADFRNFTYSLPNIRGLNIHMEEKVTTVTIPANHYDKVMKVLNNSSDHILAFGGNFSATADSHLVCIQDTQGNNENNYTTHIINIQNKPRKVTGASFIVFNGALKSSSGLTAKSSIVEDGLMIQIPAEHMLQVRDSLRNMKNHTIQCGCVNAASDETVSIVWGEPDLNFNVGLKSSVDEQALSGVPSIRVHKGKDYVCNSGGRLIRWTEVFLMQSGEENARMQDPVDISKVAESISKATCQALVKYLDLLATNNFYKIGIRTTLHVENVSYSAGSNGIKLPPIYMKSLDNELIPVLHRITSNTLGDSAIILELVFRILNV